MNYSDEQEVQRMIREKTDPGWGGVISFFMLMAFVLFVICYVSPQVRENIQEWKDWKAAVNEKLESRQ